MVMHYQDTSTAEIPSSRPHISLRVFFITLCLGWSVAVGTSLWYNVFLHRTHALDAVYTLWVTHGALWLVGLLGISFGVKRLYRWMKERDEAEGQMLALAKELEERVNQRTADLKARQQEFQAFMDNAHAGVFIKDLGGLFRFANMRFASIFGLDVADIPGQRNEVIYPVILARTMDGIEMRAVREARAIEYRHHCEGETGKGYSFFIFPIMEEQVVAALGGLAVDMTARERVEKALREARRAAERANQTKSDFLANMSHEIRTPLNGVIGMADILLRTNLSQEQTAMASAIKTSGDALLLLLNDILDLSKVESGKMVLERTPFQLRDTLFATAGAVAHIAYDKNIELVIDIGNNVPDSLTGDSTRIRQILLNLMNNALKFTEKGEVRVTVCLSSFEQDKAHLEFAVSDTGIGIPQDKLSSIFNAFEQADSSVTRKYGGTGLGLAICSKLLQAMGSSIELASEPGKGSCFSFSLVLPSAEQSDYKKNLPSFTGKRILLADRNASLTKLLAEVLSNTGAVLDVCNSIEDVDAVAKNWHDALVFGQRFVEDNYESLMRLRDSVPHGVESPAFFMGEGSMKQNIKHTFAGLLCKPVNPEKLLQMLMDVFEGKKIVPAAEGMEAEQGESRSILLVEDVEVNRTVATYMFNELGHSATEAANGQEALAVLKRQSFDLVFMDVQMPVLDGVTATRHWREWERGHPERPRAIIIAMTANALKGDREKCLEAGMDDYVSKPFNIEDIKEVINRYPKRQTDKGWLSAA